MDTGFFQQLSTALGENTLSFLQAFTSSLPKEDVACLHMHFLPADQTRCFTAGTADKGKAMAIRKSTVLAAAAKFLKLKGLDGSALELASKDAASTKVRLHQVFMLAKCTTAEELAACVASMEEKKQVILHLCGHGICSDEIPKACVNPDHLEWGLQSTNVKQTGAHEVLALVQSLAEYNFLLTIFQHKAAFQRLF